MAMPCFCTENSWTTEAILRATTIAGERFGIPDPAVCVGFTAGYHGRSLLSNYLACGNMRVAFEALLSDLEILAAADGPYGACRAFPVLDHGQPDVDSDLLEDCVDRVAFVMFDGSELPFGENIRRTARYVEHFSDRVVVEGAVDELKDAAADGGAFELTTPEQAERFLRETGCDLIVPNVGTEHRAEQAGKAQYHGHRAREIAELVGPRLVLHGTSCLGDADLTRLPTDGIVKVNIWTIIERKGAEQVARHVLQHLGHMVAPDVIRELVQTGELGDAFNSQTRLQQRYGEDVRPRLDTFPLANLRNRWVERTAETLARYFEMFGRPG